MRNKILSCLVGILLSMLLLISVGGKENKDTTSALQALHVDKLMPPNERVYIYIEEYSKKYHIPKEYILRCAFLESNYKGLEHNSYAPYEDRLVSSANAYSVLQVRTIAAREVWPHFGYIPKHKFFVLRVFSEEWFKEKKKQHKYRTKHGILTGIKLEYKSDAKIAKMLRYDLRFNVETGIKYMAFLYKRFKNYTIVYSVYNQGWVGSRKINSYARWITG